MEVIIINSSPEPESKDQKPKKRRLKKQGIITPHAISELVAEHALAKKKKEDAKLILKEKRLVAAELLKEANVAMTEVAELQRLRGVSRVQMEAGLGFFKTKFIEIAEKAELAAKEVEELEAILGKAHLDQKAAAKRLY